MQKAIAIDESGSIPIVWFNQPFIKNHFKKTTTFLVAAKLDSKSQKPQLLSPDIEPVIDGQENVHIGRITPVYSLTEGIKQKWLRKKLKWLIDYLDYITDLNDELSVEILQQFGLSTLKEALNNIHFPEDKDLLHNSKKRLGFDELLVLQLQLETQRRKRAQKKSIHIDPKRSTLLYRKLKKKLPFILTKGQDHAITEIIEDLSNPLPMRRLVQGDVGSGKTLIAIVSALIVADAGYNGIIMAPTSILAQQLYTEFSKYLNQFDIQTTLVMGDTLRRGDYLSGQDTTKDRKGNNQAITGVVMIGTHALLYPKETPTSTPGIVIIDEQHRFGVKQRNELLKETKIEESTQLSPNYLIMSATPIPRTITQMIFGDIDGTEVKDKPLGRKEVSTYLTPNNKRMDAYTWIKKEIKQGGQVFWVCPIIDKSEKIQAKSVTETFLEIEKEFPNSKVKLLHGKIPTEEKNQILQSFSNQEFDILVSTSVIEVGIDIPNANLIVIEGAERFGLAQIHQLRGRVGRRDKAGYCIIFTTEGSTHSNDVYDRLLFFSKENNGFKIAEYDLQRRGPGEVYGEKQAGIPDLKIASFDDIELLEMTKTAAIIILDQKVTKNPNK